MFERDTWQEILDTIRANKLRTFLTGFSVAWGIFMLVTLLGMGRGLENGIHYQFQDDAINMISVDPGRTQVPYKGFPVGRQITLQNKDFQDLTQQLDDIEFATIRHHLGERVSIRHRDRQSTFAVRGVHPDHLHLVHSQMRSGRYLNHADLLQRRKVVVLGRLVAQELFGNRPPLGQSIQIFDMPYQVIGVFDDAGDEDEALIAYVPSSTAQITHGGGQRVDEMLFTVEGADLEQSEQLEQGIRHVLAQNHHFHPGDEEAIELYNSLADYLLYMNLYRGIEVFIWLVGLGTLMAGAVGVSNIMLITIKERTREIGLRKAIGASPGSIVSQFLLESVAITLIAGLFGLSAGITMIRTLDFLMTECGAQADLFRHPNIQVGVIFAAIAVLVTTGTLAGWVPARRAANIKPVAALRDEA